MCRLYKIVCVLCRKWKTRLIFPRINSPIVSKWRTTLPSGPDAELHLPKFVQKARSLPPAQVCCQSFLWTVEPMTSQVVQGMTICVGSSGVDEVRLCWEHAPRNPGTLKIFVLTTVNEWSEIQGFRQSTLINWTKALHRAEQNQTFLSHYVLLCQLIINLTVSHCPCLACLVSATVYQILIAKLLEAVCSVRLISWGCNVHTQD